MRDKSTDGIQIGAVPAVARVTTEHPTTDGRLRPEVPSVGYDAAVIVISHPENRRLGARFRLAPGGKLEFGRSPDVEVSLPEVASLSRRHAVLLFRHGRVTLEDHGGRDRIHVAGSGQSG